MAQHADKVSGECTGAPGLPAESILERAARHGQSAQKSWGKAGGKKETGPWGDKGRSTEKRRKEIRITSYAFCYCKGCANITGDAEDKDISLQCMVIFNYANLAVAGQIILLFLLNPSD